MISREEWLAERKNGIGSSDAAAVFAEGYSCPRELYYDKTGVERNYDHTPESLAIFDRGHELEPGICRKFAQETGLTLRRTPTIVSEGRPWFRANLDRRIESFTDPHTVEARYRNFADMGPGYLEAKTANQHVFADIKAHGVPNHYAMQMQHGLGVSGYQWGAFAVREPYTFAFLHFPVKRNERLIEILMEVEEAFWKRVQAGDIPDKLEDFNDSRCQKCGYRLSCRNAEAIPAVRYRKPVYRPDSSEDLFEVVGQIKALTAMRDQVEAELASENQKLLRAMEERDATHLLVPEQGKKITRFWVNGALRYDTAALDSERPELAERYKRRGEGRWQLKLSDVNEMSEVVREALKEVA